MQRELYRSRFYLNRICFCFGGDTQQTNENFDRFEMLVFIPHGLGGAGHGINYFSYYSPAHP